MLTPQEVADDLGIGYESAKDLMADGTIPSTNIASPKKRAQWRTTQQAVDRYKMRPVAAGVDRGTGGSTGATIYQLEEGPLETWAEQQKRKSRAA